MSDTFVTVSLTEFEFDELVEILSQKEIGSGLGNLYEKLLAASESEDQEDDAEDE